MWHRNYVRIIEWKIKGFFMGGKIVCTQNFDLKTIAATHSECW